MRKRSKFNLSHVNSTTCKMGYIVPVMVSEGLPGDTFQGDTKCFTRVAPLVAPVMHRVRQQLYTFAVPLRLLWNNWENFITGGQDGLDASVPPTVSVKPTVSSLSDYFGLPLTNTAISVSALPFRAYNLIWNQYFRDQDLQDEIEISLEDGEDETTPTELLRPTWQKDYFTTARPNPQKGPAIGVPIDLTAGGQPLITATTTLTGGSISGNGSPTFTTSNSIYDQTVRFQSGSRTSRSLIYYSNSDNSANVTWNNPALKLNNPTATTSINYNGSEEATTGAFSIDDFREQMALQRWEEKRSLYGSRYEDLLRFWGLQVQDYRLQKAELISTSNTLLQFSEVLQTSPENGAGVGNMSGHGMGASRSGRWRYYCHEHCLIMTFLVVRPEAVYTQGIERMWSRNTRFHYWNPEFQHIGQQQVLSKEVYADGSESDETVFGYQNRYDEYRRGKNHVSGEFRTTLNYWNMARIFENRPSLNDEFVTVNPTDRIYQLSESLSDQLYIMIQNDLLAKRLISKNGNPV